jgi:hypothetical protein
MTNIAASKSSLQSDVGALSRRSKLGAKITCISSTGCPQYMGAQYPTFSSQLSSPLGLNQYLYGNPAVRTISKITSRVMDLTLKVKSTESLEGISPNLTMLRGSKSWPVIFVTRFANINNKDTASFNSDIEATPSLWHISRMPPIYRLQVCIGCVTM